MTNSVSYLRIIADRETGPLLLAANFSRLSSGLVPFGLVAFYTDRGETSLAGIAAVTFMVALSLTAPYKGRFVTRFSPVTSIIPMSLLFSVVLVVGVSLDAAGAGFVPAIIGIAAGAACSPPTPAVVRSIWTNIAETQPMNRALHALDSTTEELTFAISPLITAVLWSTIGPFWSIPIGLTAGLLGNTAIVYLASRRSSTSRTFMTRRVNTTSREKALHAKQNSKKPFSLYLQPSATGLLLPMIGLGGVMGGLTLVLPSWAGENLGAQSASGVILGIISFVGFASGLIFGKLPDKWMSARSQYQVSAGLIAVGALVFAISSNLFGAILAAVLIGIGMTPMSIAAFTMVGDYFSGNAHTEINASLGASFNIGDGLASLLCGFALVTFGTGQVLLILGLCTLTLSAMSIILPRSSPNMEEQKDEVSVDEKNNIT